MFQPGLWEIKPIDPTSVVLDCRLNDRAGKAPYGPLKDLLWPDLSPGVPASVLRLQSGGNNIMHHQSRSAIGRSMIKSPVLCLQKGGFFGGDPRLLPC